MREEERERERERTRSREKHESPSFSLDHSLSTTETLVLFSAPPPPLPLSPIAMRSTLDSTRVSTRSTVAARASMGKQQSVAAAAPAAPTSKPTSSIDSKERWATSTLPVAARVFSAVAAAMVAVTGPAFADLNAFEAAAGGGKREKELRELEILKRGEFSTKKNLSASPSFSLALALSRPHPPPPPPSHLFFQNIKTKRTQSSASALPSSLATPPSTARTFRSRTCAGRTSRAPSAGGCQRVGRRRSFFRDLFVSKKKKKLTLFILSPSLFPRKPKPK